MIVQRKVGEAVAIPLPDGRVAVVKVARILDGEVRLGIDAPPDVPVHRSEERERVKREAGR